MSPGRRLGRSLAVAATALLGSCAGIFQREMPAAPARYEMLVPVAGDLLVGSAERDATPAVGGYLAGFDVARTSTRVGSPLAVRALVVATSTRRFAIVGIDNLGVMREDADWIKSGIAGFANGDVFLCASHTHAGPDLIGIWGFYGLSTGRDRDYLAALRVAVAEAVAEAAAAAVPARLTLGEALLPPAGIVKNSNRAGIFDRRFVVLHARAIADDRPVGTLLHFACHPEVLPRRNTAISSDFVGGLCDEWRRRGKGQAVFVNGALGAMVSPDWPQRDDEGALACGAALADLAEQALAGGAPLPVDAIEVRRRDVYLPMASTWFRLGRVLTVLPRQLYAGHARSTVGMLRLGSFTAIAVPGEMEPLLAAQLRTELRLPDAVLFGLCDDEVGYLLRRADARDPEFAYEVSMSPCVDAGERVRAAITGVPVPVR